MLTRDFAKLSLSSIVAHRLRSGLTVLGIAVGIGAVVLLTSIGEGIHQFVLSEFTQFGTNLVAINPGKAMTMGTPIGALGSVRPLSIDDSFALERIPNALAVVPVVQGNAEVEFGPRARRTTVLGVGPRMPEVFRMRPQLGHFLPPDDPRTPRAYTVLGAKVKNELFGAANPLGQYVRVGGDRYRVIGVMESKGQILGFDMDDTLYIPAVRAQELFNRDGLMEIDVLYHEEAPVTEVVAAIKRILNSRHGKEDFTLTTQAEMLDVLGNILSVITFAVGALGGISLVVGSIGILTIMTIAVTERTPEIGLLRALGAERGQIQWLFLSEAAVLAAIGGFIGLVLGAGGAQLLSFAIPALPVHTPWSYVLAAEVLATTLGLVAGVLPARHAARLDPIEALRTE